MTVSTANMILLNKRKQKVGVLRRNGKVASFYVYLSIISGTIINIGSVFYYIHKKQTFESIFLSIGTSVFILALILFIIRWRSFKKPLTDNKNITIAPTLVSDEIYQLIANVAEKMTIHLNTVVVLLSKRCFSIFPSMIEREGQIQLVVPIGFLKVIRTNPGIAKAILSHELAHAEQHDTHLWSLANIYWSVLIRTIFPYYCILLLITLSLALFLTINVSIIRTRLEKGKNIAYKEIDDQYKEHIKKIESTVYPDPSFYYRTLRSKELDKMTADTARDNARSTVDMKYSEIMTPLETGVFGAWLGLFQICMSIFWFLLFYSAIRYLRRLSEETADLAVVLHDNGILLINALALIGKEKNRWRFFTIHPSTDWRKKQITTAMVS